MRKHLLFVIAVIIPYLVGAQLYYNFSEISSSKARLLSINNATVLIEPLSEDGDVQKWLSFDTSLNLLSARKLVTPNAENIIGQTYLEGVNEIVRIDQLIIDDIFYVSAFVFDKKGNIIKQQDINLAAAAKSKLLAAPFMVIQSPDKRFISLLQMQRNNFDSIMVAALSIDENLATITSNQFSVSLDDNLEELLMPLSDNKGNIFILTANKFDSYRLGTNCNAYVVSGNNNHPQQFALSFSRKKLSNSNFHIEDDNLHFSALYSNAEDKEAIVGILYGHYDLGKQQFSVQKENVFDESFKNSLKKKFENQGYKSNMLNYLTILPNPSLISKQVAYAVLLPVVEGKAAAPKNKAPKYDNSLQEIQSNLNYVNSFVGTQPAGYSKPMNYIEAQAYAHSQIAGKVLPANKYYESEIFKEKNKRPAHKKQGYSTNNLLLLDTDGRQQFVKLKLPADPELHFFAYLPEEHQYSALHYHSSSVGKAYLKLTTINPDGIISEKNVLENKSKILLNGYSYTINANSLIAFFQDKNTGEMGLVKIKL